MNKLERNTEELIKVSAILLPSIGIPAVANWAVIWGTIQAFAVIPPSLHTLTVAFGVLLLFPFNFVVIPASIGLGMLLFALLDQK